VVFDPGSHELIGFSLNKRGWFRGTLRASLPASDVTAIGPDAVMIAHDDDLTDPVDAPDSLVGRGVVFSVTGTTVLTESGTELGTIDDLVVETCARPEAVGYRVSGPNGMVFVPISAQMALSADNILLPTEAEAFVRNDLSGFGAAVADYRRDLDRRAPHEPAGLETR